MKLLTPIAHFLLCAVIGPAAVAQSASPSGRALLISDIHLDPLADPAIVKRLIAAPVSEWEAILESSQQKPFSAYGSDTNYRLFVSTLAAAAAQEPFDYVVFTGDALRHNFLPAFVAAGGTSDQFPEFTAKTEAFVVQELQEKLKVPVVAALGNDDSSCGDYQIPPDSPFLATTANQFDGAWRRTGGEKHIPNGGFYSDRPSDGRQSRDHCFEQWHSGPLRTRAAPRIW